MPSYSKRKGASFATGPGRTFMAGSRSTFRGPSKTAMRGPNPSKATRITRRAAVGAGPRRVPSAENILLAGGRGKSANDAT